MEQNIHKVKNGKETMKEISYLDWNSEMIIGIDPGKSGGVAWIHNSKLYAKNCPDDVDQMSQLIKDIIKIKTRQTQQSICYLEAVHAFPTDGRSSAFKFGMNFGIWQGILSSLNIKIVLVTPQKWQKLLGELPKNKKERKNMMKQIASDLSGLKATLKTADAILLALHGYKELNG